MILALPKWADELELEPLFASGQRSSFEMVALVHGLMRLRRGRLRHSAWSDHQVAPNKSLVANCYRGFNWK